MAYCKHCREYVSASQTFHICPRKGLLNVSDDDSFLVSALIGSSTDSAILGGLIGGNIVGGILGDMLDGDLFD